MTIGQSLDRQHYKKAGFLTRKCGKNEVNSLIPSQS